MKKTSAELFSLLSGAGNELEIDDFLMNGLPEKNVHQLGTNGVQDT